ncbi:MAG: type II secretion system protein [Bacilli bacterium]|nr:type II secretion system protein [Bacilli bacterium]
MKTKGFTLVEVLATVLIIGVLSLITGPMIVGAIAKADKNTFKRDVEGIVRTIKTSQDESNYGNETYTIENGDIIRSTGEKLSTKGGSNETGSATIDEDGYITLAVKKKNWCATKKANTETIEISDNATDCKLPTSS